MSVHDEISDSEVLHAASKSLSAMPMASPPDVQAIMARGRAHQRRRLSAVVGLPVAAAGTALALGLTGVFSSASVQAPGTIRTMSFTLVSHHNGTATLTINPDELLDATALQNDLQQAGIPAHVTSGSFCHSDPGPSLAVVNQVLSGGLNPGPGTHPDTITFNPAAMPAGTELNLGVFQPSSATSGSQEADLNLIYANSYTCTSDPNAHWFPGLGVELSGQGPGHS